MRSNKTSILKFSIVILALTVLYLSVFWLSKTISAYQSDYHNLLTVLNVIKYGLYTSAIFFFVGIYFILELINLIEKDIFFSKKALNNLSFLKYIIFTILVLYSSVLLYVYIRVGFIKSIFIVGGLVIFITAFLIIFIEIFIQLLEKAVNIKLENDLTI